MDAFEVVDTGAGAVAGFCRGADGAEGAVAHFLRTASSVNEPAAVALFDIWAICCAAGLEAGAAAAADVDPQLWSAGNRCCGQNCCLQFCVYGQIMSSTWVGTPTYLAADRCK